MSDSGTSTRPRAGDSGPFAVVSPTSEESPHDVDTVGSLLLESLWARKRVSTGVHGALDDPPVVQTKI